MDNQILILSELCTGGTLFDLIQKYDGALKEAQIIFVLRNVSRGLLHLHNQQISHRDLKIENVLLEGKQFKLCDFGSSWR